MSVMRLGVDGAWQGALVGLLVAGLPAGAFLLGDTASSTRSGEGLSVSADALFLLGFAAADGLGAGACVGAVLGLVSGLVVTLCVGRMTTSAIVATAVAAAAAALGAVVLVIGGVEEPRWSISLGLAMVVLAGLPLVVAVAKEVHRSKQRAAR